MPDLLLDGPAKNALGTAMMRSILDRLAAAKGEPLFVTGAGDAFSAGLNLKEVAALEPAGMEKFLALLEEVMTSLYLYPGPTVALVNGHAIAGGCILALCCDHRVAVASEKARIGVNEVALGLRFPPRILRIVRDRVAPRHLGEVVLGAALHPPAGAVRVGLVDELGDEALARARLAGLAAHPRDAYAAAKRALRGEKPQDLGSDADEARWMRESGGAWTAPELKQKLLAVLKR